MCSWSNCQLRACMPAISYWISGRSDRSNERVFRYMPGVPSMTFPRASQALSRFTVLDVTRVRSGPTCVRQLADWGANVIKIDAPMEDAPREQPGGPRHGSDFQNL